MSASTASPQSGDRGTFKIATWNIRCGQNLGLAFAAKGLAQMRVRYAILTEIKITDNRYSKFALGYKQGGGGVPLCVDMDRWVYHL